jgi:hypothetical protein
MYCGSRAIEFGCSVQVRQIREAPGGKEALAHEADRPLDPTLQVWGSWRQSYDVDALMDEYVTKFVRVFCVAEEN